MSDTAVNRALLEAAADQFLRIAAYGILGVTNRVTPNVDSVRGAVAMMKEAVFVWEQLHRGELNDSIDSHTDEEPAAPVT